MTTDRAQFLLADAVRKQVAPWQLSRYYDPDAQRVVDPLEDPEVVSDLVAWAAAAHRFIRESNP